MKGGFNMAEQKKNGAWKMLSEIHRNTFILIRYMVQLTDLLKDLKPSPKTAVQTRTSTPQSASVQPPKYTNGNYAVFSVGIIAPIPSFSDMQLAKCAKAGYSINDLAILSGYNTAYIYDHVKAYYEKYPNKR